MHSQQTKQEIPLEVRELTPEAFSQWKHHPVTRALRAWLRECRALALEQHSQRWVERQELPDGGEDESRARCLVYQELADVELNHIMRTYYSDDELEPDGRLKPPPKNQEETEE